MAHNCNNATMLLVRIGRRVLIPAMAVIPSSITSGIGTQMTEEAGSIRIHGRPALYLPAGTVSDTQHQPHVGLAESMYLRSGSLVMGRILAESASHDLGAKLQTCKGWASVQFWTRSESKVGVVWACHRCLKCSQRGATSIFGLGNNA